MQIDYKQKFSDEQAVTVSAASTNLLRIGAPGDIRKDVVIMVDETATTSTTSNVTFTVRGCDLENRSDAATIASSATYAHSALTAGRQIIVIPVAHITTDYIDVYYTASATLTAGKFTAVLVDAAQTNK